MMIAVSLLVFPKLALGLSGFETGVAVMPQSGRPATPGAPRPIRNPRLLTTAALIMSVFLVASSLVTTTLLIPAEEFQPGGAANGRALASWPTSTSATASAPSTTSRRSPILWFAGASAMAGLLNLIPRYLPRYGMAPEWAGAVRPLVLVLTAIAFADHGGSSTRTSTRRAARTPRACWC